MSDRVYKKIEVTGTSATSIEEAVENAVAKAAKMVQKQRLVVRSDRDTWPHRRQQSRRMANYAEDRLRLGGLTPSHAGITRLRRMAGPRDAKQVSRYAGQKMAGPEDAKQVSRYDGRHQGQNRRETSFALRWGSHSPQGFGFHSRKLPVGDHRRRHRRPRSSGQLLVDLRKDIVQFLLNRGHRGR